MGLSDRLNASNAEFEKMLNMSLPQKIEYIRLQGIAEDLKIHRETPKQSPIMNPLQSPIIDPFEITPDQYHFASEKAFELHQRRCERKLTEAEVLQKQIFDSIHEVLVSRSWARRGDLDPHWSEVSARAIAQLQQLGFRDNADVQRYLDYGEMPNA